LLLFGFINLLYSFYLFPETFFPQENFFDNLIIRQRRNNHITPVLSRTFESLPPLTLAIHFSVKKEDYARKSREWENFRVGQGLQGMDIDLIVGNRKGRGEEKH
jgi:hypothetical protein